MSRAVTADHVLFDECIDAFRPNGDKYFRLQDGPSCSYLLTDFALTSSWLLPNCTVHPSVRVHLPGAYSAFISRVDNPISCDGHNAHLFGIALAAIVTFVSGRPCRSTRDDYLSRREIGEHDMARLAILHPILTAGPGCTHSSISDSSQRKYADETGCVISGLQAIDYAKYLIVMQAIRLIHLSLLTKRDDFGLAYLLVVSAIESVAQHAIKRDKIKRKNPEETKWAARAQRDPEFANVLKAYQEARGQNQYLKERYIEFIQRFAPVTEWEKYVSHPLQHLADYVDEILPASSINHITKKNWFEKYPNDLMGNELIEILAASYTHRSCFIHRGEQPPHREPTSYNRFFQEHRQYDGNSLTERLLPNYELLVGIAQCSIRGWVDSLAR